MPRTYTTKSVGRVMAYTLTPRVRDGAPGADVKFAILPDVADFASDANLALARREAVNLPTPAVADMPRPFDVIPRQRFFGFRLNSTADAGEMIVGTRPGMALSRFTGVQEFRGYKILFGNSASIAQIRQFAAWPFASYYVDPAAPTSWKQVIGLTPACFADAPVAAGIKSRAGISDAEWTAMSAGDCALFVSDDHPGVRLDRTNAETALEFRTGRMRRYVKSASATLPFGATRFNDDGYELANTFVDGEPNTPAMGVRAGHNPSRSNVDITLGGGAFKLWGGWDAGYMAFRVKSFFLTRPQGLRP
jgi:hypothetical protein